MSAPTEYRTPPLSERPRAKNLIALRKMRIGPIWPVDPDHEVGMRGTVPPKATARRWVAYRGKRRQRRQRRLAANASRRANR